MSFQHAISRKYACSMSVDCVELLTTWSQNATDYLIMLLFKTLARIVGEGPERTDYGTYAQPYEYSNGMSGLESVTQSERSLSLVDPEHTPGDQSESSSLYTSTGGKVLSERDKPSSPISTYLESPSDGQSSLSES